MRGDAIGLAALLPLQMGRTISLSLRGNHWALVDKAPSSYGCPMSRTQHVLVLLGAVSWYHRSLHETS